MLHVPMIEAACGAGKAVFSEKPIGGKPEHAVAAYRAARAAGVPSGVGYNYLWAPLVLHARAMVAEGRLGRITHYRGRFLSMYGSDELGLLTWRFKLAEAGYGVTSDILSHSVSMARFLLGDEISELVGMRETTIPSRPLPTGAASHYGRGRPEDPHGDVENEDFASMLCRFAGGATGTFECSRTMVGPESQNAFEIYGTEGSLAWNLERVNELQYYRRGPRPRPAGRRSSRRPLPVPRCLRARAGQRDRLRGPRRDRGPRVPPEPRHGGAVLAVLRRRGRRGRRPAGARRLVDQPQVGDRPAAADAGGRRPGGRRPAAATTGQGD